MINIIGIGSAGCAVADALRAYDTENYESYKIDVGLPKGKKCFSVAPRINPEDYETKFPARVATALAKIRGDVLVVIGGGGAISSAALRVLECVTYNNKVEVFYIKPDESFISEGAIILDKIVYGILQEYARSGAIDRMYMVSNGEIERVVGNIPLSSYYEKLNDIMASTYHMMNVYKNSSPVISNLTQVPTLSRLSTIGVATFEKVEDQMFFPLDYVSEKVYYFAINKERLDKDKELLGKIKLRIKQADATIKTGFGVYATSYPDDYVYVVANAKIIQGVQYDD